jgi:hypothetical protein
MTTAVFLGISFGTPSARATTNRMPAQHTSRDLVTPAKTIRLDGGPRWVLPTGQMVFLSTDPVILNAGASFGIVDDFELGFVQPLQLAPDGDILDPTIHGLYQFTKGTVDVGLHFHARIPVFEAPGYFGSLIGVPLYIHVAHNVRLDLGGFLLIDFPNDDLSLGMAFPFLVPINVTRQLFLGPEIAFITTDDGDGDFHRFDDVAVPLGFFIGYTIETGGGTLGDISARFRNLDLTEDFDPWAIILAADFFFDL